MIYEYGEPRQNYIVDRGKLFMRPTELYGNIAIKAM
jgi:hypothetical protein